MARNFLVTKFGSIGGLEHYLQIILIKAENKFLFAGPVFLMYMLIANLHIADYDRSIAGQGKTIKNMLSLDRYIARNHMIFANAILGKKRRIM